MKKELKNELIKEHPELLREIFFDGFRLGIHEQWGRDHPGMGFFRRETSKEESWESYLEYLIRK